MAERKREKERKGERASVQVSHKLLQILDWLKLMDSYEMFKEYISLRVQCYIYVLQSIFLLLILSPSFMQSDSENDAY